MAASQYIATDILTDLSLRELAAALGLSHQRVHQIVEAAGGGAPVERRHERRLATTVNNPTGGKVAGDAAIWAEYLALCREIHAENLA